MRRRVSGAEEGEGGGGVGGGHCGTARDQNKRAGGRMHGDACWEKRR